MYFDMKIRKANKEETRTIAELAQFAGEGIPDFFWAQSQRKGESLLDVGARNASSETENFSYRNAWLAVMDGETAGMLLAYRLPSDEHKETLSDYPKFIHPLIELERLVPNSFYINMLAAYPQFRNRGIGRGLMSVVDELASEAGCDLISIEVFEQNAGALRFYQRLGYTLMDSREVIPHPCHHYDGRLLLLTKSVDLPHVV